MPAPGGLASGSGDGGKSLRPSPSFLIGPANAPPEPSAPLPGSGLRLDRINSRQLLQAARQIYFPYLAGSGGREPLGVVMVGETDQGRVVFAVPVLLPEEQFVPMELMRNRGLGRPSRASRLQVPRPSR